MIDLPDWSTTDVLWMRALLGAALLVNPVVIAGGSRTAPVGLAKWIDPSRLLDHRWAAVALPALVPIHVSGLASPAPALVLATLLILTITIRSSDGAVSHGYHLLTIVVTCVAAAETAQWIADAGDLDWAIDERTPAAWAVQGIVAMYFAAGASKVLGTGGEWIGLSPRLELSMMVKSYQSLGADHDSRTEAFSRFVRRYPKVIRTTAGIGLLVEILAPLGLLHPVALFVTGVVLVALHIFNGALLQLPFRLNQAIVAIYLIAFSLDIG